MMDIFGFNKIKTRSRFYGISAMKDPCSKAQCLSPTWLPPETRDNIDASLWNPKRPHEFLFLSLQIKIKISKWIYCDRGLHMGQPRWSSSDPAHSPGPFSVTGPPRPGCRSCQA